MILSLQRDVLPIRLPLTRLELKRPAPVYAEKFAELFDIPRALSKP